MESFDPQFFYLVLFFAITALLILQLGCRKTSRCLPPGPWRLPVIGSLHHLAGGQLIHHRLRDLARDHGPLMYLLLGQRPAVVVSSPDAAREIMKTHDINFASKSAFLSGRILLYGCRNIIAAPYGEYWRTVRKASILHLLSVRRVRSYRHIREEEVSAMVETISSFASAIPIDMSAKFKALSNSVTSRAAVGSKNKHQELMLACMDEVFRVSLFELPDLFPSWESPLLWLTGIKRKLTKISQKMDAILDEVISEHRAKFAARVQEGGNVVSVEGLVGEGEENLLDQLINHYEQQDLGFELSINDIKAILQDIFIAGTNTTAATMEWALSELMRNPEVMDKAQKEARQVFHKHGNLDETHMDQLHYLKLVIAETLRLHPPFSILFPRDCKDTTIIGNYKIKQGTKVIINVWALGRDPNYWENPEEFKPDRFLLNDNNNHSGPIINHLGTDFRFLPFGAGRRICPGATFGMEIVQLALARLLCQFDWKLPKGNKCISLNMDEKFETTVTRKFPLYLVATNHFS